MTRNPRPTTDRILVPDSALTDAVERLLDWSLPFLRQTLGISTRHLSHLLSVHTADLDPPRFRFLKHTWTRVLTTREARLLKSWVVVRPSKRRPSALGPARRRGEVGPGVDNPAR